MSIKKDIVWRVGLVYTMVLVIAFGVIGRVLYLQLIEGDKWREKAQTLSHRDIIVPANRGDVCANDGRLLASSLPFYELRMDFRAPGLKKKYFDAKVDSLALCLSRFFRDRSAREYRKMLRNARYRKKSNRYVLINRRKVNYNELKKIKTFPIFRLGQNKGGLICKQENRRIQPHINLATRTIGYLNEESNSKLTGRVGIEGGYESYLKGVDGVSVMQKMSGRWLPVNQVEPRDGKDVITTLDVNYQDVAESALLNQLKRYHADHGTVVLMEVKTGAIRAIANLGRDSVGGAYRENYNYAIGEASEPGSTFKLASMMALLEDGYVRLTDSVETGNGVYKFYDRKMKDAHRGGFGKISVAEAFEKSSNVGISRLVNDNYAKMPSRFVNRLYGFHLKEPLGVEIRGEGMPYIKYPDDPLWSGTSLPWMSIGYELTLTPLQILALYNTIANNGRMMKPQLVKELRYHGEVVKEYDPQVIDPMICSRETLRKVQGLLKGVVQRGTAQNIKNPNYSIAGKTGTAQVADKNKGYQQKVYQASFAGYFPAEKPVYSCVVVIYGPNRSLGFYGNQVAGPVFKTIADKVYALSYGMHPPRTEDLHNAVSVPISLNGCKSDLNEVFEKLDIKVTNNNIQSKWVISARKDSVIEYRYRRIKPYQVPNVKGMGLKDALYILENAGLRVRTRGVGVVVGQSLPSGSLFRKGDVIEIKLA